MKKSSMSFFARIKLFQKTATGILVFFFGMMILVTIVAHLRQSGSTGMDMMKIHQKIQDKKIADEQPQLLPLKSP